jgi:cell division protein FtsI (penicillin-binding protein 3)
MFLFILVFSVAIVWKVFYLQNIQGEKWRIKSKRTYVKELTVPATRGNIYADDGSLLATSLPKYKLGFDPTVSMRNKKNREIYDSGIDSLCHFLSATYGDRDWKDYYAQIDLARREKNPYIILSNELIDYQTVKKMRKWPIFRRGKFKGGVVFDKVETRYNPFGRMGFRTIGYRKDKDAVGIENSFNNQLAGVAGKGIFEKIAGGSWRSVDGGEETIPMPGVDIHTTLNVNIQDVAETSLLKALRQYNADKGCVVVMEVATGQIKAMTNLTKINDTLYAENYNHAVLGRTDPGSVFKLPSMVAMMEEGGLGLNEYVSTGDGTITISGSTMRDSKSHGTITAQQVFELSSNVGTMRLMQKYFHGKKQKYYDYLTKFRLNQPLHFQLRPDAIPYIAKPDKWSATTMPWMSVGYESLVTPLQMLTFYNAIANNGKWIQPIIVQSTREADNIQDDFTVSQERSSDPICSEATLAKVRVMLEGVVERGTASNIKNPMYKIAGKTGTSQKLIGRNYIKGMYYTSFIGYFPADAPKYSCVVVIDNPKGVDKEALYARDVSAPVFKEIADKIYACDIQMHKLLTPTTGDRKYFATQRHIANTGDAKKICEELGIEKLPQSEGWTSTRSDGGILEWKGIEYAKNKVPDTRGMNLRDAIYVLENKGFKVDFKGSGKVASQSIPPNSVAVRGRTIGLFLQ